MSSSCVPERRKKGNNFKFTFLFLLICIQSILIYPIFIPISFSFLFVLLALAERKTSVANVPNIQFELLDCIGIVKGEISDVLVLLEQYIDDNADTAECETLETILTKLNTVVLLSRGVQDYILEIDSPSCHL